MILATKNFVRITSNVKQQQLASHMVPPSRDEPSERAHFFFPFTDNIISVFVGGGQIVSSGKYASGPRQPCNHLLWDM
jgi:hypothetical protein